MVANRGAGTVEHREFRDLTEYLHEGDALVVNTSQTVPASIKAHNDDGAELKIHLASAKAKDLWSVEIRTPNGEGTKPGPDLGPQALHLPGGAVAHLLEKSYPAQRLRLAAIEGIGDVTEYLDRYGEPIRYGPGQRWPISDYQTVFALEPGSAEMPSAGRPFTRDLVVRLVSLGVVVLPILLHTGVSSFEDHEYPGKETFRVPATTARVANTLRQAGGRIVAVGTTVLRALETAIEPDGTLRSSEGQTELLVTPESGVHAVDGLLTGWHEPRSSHLKLLEAVAGRELLQRCYEEALETGYLWHEFGDELLILS